MKKILFIAIIIAQLLGALEGVLMEGKEYADFTEKELKQENAGEPEIFSRTATRIIIAGFLTFAYGSEISEVSGEVADVLQKSTTVSEPLFIRHRCLRV